MTRFTQILTAAVVLAGSATVALAERPEFDTAATFGSQVEVVAGDVLNAKGLSRGRLSADDVLNVTVAPAGEQAWTVGSDR